MRHVKRRESIATKRVARGEVTGLAGDRLGQVWILKALAFDGRGENKDAYDLIYLLQNYGDGIEDVFRRLQPLLNTQFAEKALQVLRRDFAEVDAVGTKRVAGFLGDPDDETIRADAAGAVRSLLDLC